MVASRRNDGAIDIFEKEADELSPLLRREWLRSGTAAALWRLLEACKSSAKRNLDKLTEERNPCLGKHELHNGVFAPCGKQKYQVMITNTKYMIDAVGMLCGGTGPNAVCSRTGRPHDSWNPKVVDGKATHFPSGDATGCPADLCNAMARGRRGGATSSSTTFVDFKFFLTKVFSGPNAPLTSAVQRIINDGKPKETRLAIPSAAVPNLQTGGSEVPPKPETAPASLSSSSLLTEEAPAGPPSPSTDKPKKYERPPLSSYQRADRAAGRQPRWGRGEQLIPDGLGSPYDHLRLVVQLGHPGFDEGDLDDDMVDAVNWPRHRGLLTVVERIKIVQAFEALGKELEGDRLKRAADACIGFKALGSMLHTPLMESLARVGDIKYRALPKLLEHGLPIVGRALESPFFEQHEAMSKTSVEPAFDMTMKEVAQGTMVKRSPPTNWTRSTMDCGICVAASVFAKELMNTDAPGTVRSTTTPKGANAAEGNQEGVPASIPS
jgi:hypothetical protein